MRPLEDKFRELARNLGEMMDRMTSPDYFSASGRDSWVPAANVYEIGSDLAVCVELAGVERGEVEVQLEGQGLRLRGRRAKPVLPADVGEVRVHQMEIDSGRFEREISLPAGTKVVLGEVSCRNGYLWIMLSREG